MSGSSAGDQGGVYGTKGIAAAANVPGSRGGATTWAGGSNIADQVGVYGTKGIADAANVPGARQGAVSWVDATNNVLWLFGGYGHCTGFLLGQRNDLWKYSISSDQWTWVSGGNSVV